MLALAYTFCTMLGLAAPGAAGSEALHDARILIADCSESSGIAHRIDLGDKEHAVHTLIERSARFVCTPKGTFVYQDRAGRWFRGNAKSGARKRLIVSKAPSASAVYLCLSNAGDRLSWVQPSRKAYRLVCADLASGATRTLVRRDGDIGAHAWSPDDRQIAYYAGPWPRQPGGYIAKIIRLSPGHPEPRQVAPPSLGLHITPGRAFPPSWSPDGTKILIEARYTTSVPPKYLPVPIRYLVDLKARDVQPAVEGTWRLDSRAVFTAMHCKAADGGYSSTLGVWSVEETTRPTRDLGIGMPRDTHSAA